jgi:hypothetical protein
MIVAFSDGVADATNRLLCGIFGAGAADRFALWQTTGGSSYYTNFTSAATARITAGNLAIAGKTGYKNGVADNVCGAGAVLSVATINIASRSPILGYYFSGKIQAIAIYSITLDAFQVAALGTAGTGAMANL